MCPSTVYSIHASFSVPEILFLCSAALAWRWAANQVVKIPGGFKIVDSIYKSLRGKSPQLVWQRGLCYITLNMTVSHERGLYLKYDFQVAIVQAKLASDLYKFWVLPVNVKTRRKCLRLLTCYVKWSAGWYTKRADVFSV